MFTVGIVAHLKRAGEAKALAREVKADFVSIDNGILGCDANHVAVQGHLANLPSTWSVVLEDDAIPVNNFREQLTAALPMSPSPIVSLYIGKRRPPQWQNRICKAIVEATNEDASWIVSTHLLHAVGYAIKTEYLPSLLEFDSNQPSDQHITAWARWYGHTTAYAFPSLVDHADLPTLVDHPDGQRRHPGRIAWYTGKRDNWTTKAVTL